MKVFRPLLQLPDVPGAARKREARRDLAADLATAAALDAAEATEGAGPFSGDGGLLEVRTLQAGCDEVTASCD